MRWNQRWNGIGGCDLRDSCFSPHMDGDRVSPSLRFLDHGTTDRIASGLIPHDPLGWSTGSSRSIITLFTEASSANPTCPEV
jgi:hypothetical protein